VKFNISQDAQIEAHVRYSDFKKTIKVFLTPTNTMVELKTQLRKYFIYVGENHTTYHVFEQVQCVNIVVDKNEDMWKTIHSSRVIRDDSVVEFMFRLMVENNVLYFCVRSNCRCQIVSRDLMSFSGFLTLFMYCCVMCCLMLHFFEF
jgi:hypothetical protein